MIIFTTLNMSDCSNVLPVLLKNFDSALKNYHQAITDNKKCKKSSQYLNNSDERIDVCGDYFIKQKNNELMIQSQLYNLVFKTCSLIQK